MGEIKDKEKIAELCGAIIGDGWIQSNEKGLFLAGDQVEDKDYYDFRISKLISDLFVKVKPRSFPYWRVYGISIYKKRIIKRFLDLDLPKGPKSFSAKIPKWILNSNKSILKSFVRGLFDTGGSIFFQKDYTKYANKFNAKYHVKARINFSSISFNLQEQLKKVLDRLGYRSTFRSLRKGLSKNRNNNDVHIVRINEIKGVHRFFKEIIPGNPKHTTRYLVWKKFGFCPPYTNINQRKDILKKKLNPYSLYKQG